MYWGSCTVPFRPRLGDFGTRMESGTALLDNNTAQFVIDGASGHQIRWSGSYRSVSCRSLQVLMPRIE